MNASIFGKKQDQLFMQAALAQAQMAFEKNEVPIGAVVVAPDGTIVARAFNLVEHNHTQRAHAEMLALEEATQRYGDWRLDGHWLYVTLEPCRMCMGFARLSRLAGVVYGADSPLFGYQLDNEADLRVYNEGAPLVVKGVEADKSALLLKQFFQNKREKKVSGTSSSDLESVKKILKQRKIELEEKLTQLSKEKVTDGQVQDPGDQALTSTMETLKISFQDTERKEYERILRALMKIEDGTYGICIDCGLKISERRLKSNPNVARCLVCQEIFEEGVER